MTAADVAVLPTASAAGHLKENGENSASETYFKYLDKTHFIIITPNTSLDSA